MDYVARWAIGFVALLGVIMMCWVGHVAGDEVPCGIWSVVALGGLCIVVSVVCFLPRRRKGRKVGRSARPDEPPGPLSKQARSLATRALPFAVYVGACALLG